MSHIPLIHGPDGSKLSKRHGALGVDAYRAMGYLPAAMRNYLVRLGWSHGDQEIFSTEEMIAAFDLPQIGRSPARFDFAKLESLNGHYMRIEPRPRPAGGDRRAAAASAERRRDRRQADARGPRAGHGGHARTEGAGQDPGRPDRRRKLHLGGPAARAGRQGDGAADARGPARCWPRFIPELEAVEPWTAEATEQAVRGYAERKGAKLGAVAQPLRAALTGRTTSPGIFNVLVVLGRQESLARLRDQAAAG